MLPSKGTGPFDRASVSSRTRFSRVSMRQRAQRCRGCRADPAQSSCVDPQFPQCVLPLDDHPLTYPGFRANGGVLVDAQVGDRLYFDDVLVTVKAEVPVYDLSIGTVKNKGSRWKDVLKYAATKPGTTIENVQALNHGTWVPARSISRDCRRQLCKATIGPDVFFFSQ